MSPQAQRDGFRRIDRTHLLALLAADVRRLGPPIARSIAGVLAVMGVLAATGLGGRGMITGLVTALLVMHPMFLALQLVKDKVDGTLTFLCALPVSAETLAVVRVIPIATLSVVAGIGAAALALGMDVPRTLGHGVAVVTVTVFLFGVLVPTALSSLVLALSARFSFETLASLPMLAVVALAVVGELAGRIVPAPVREQVWGFLAQPWGQVVLIALLVGTLAGTIALAVHVTARAFHRFAPERRGG